MYNGNNKGNGDKKMAETARYLHTKYSAASNLGGPINPLSPYSYPKPNFKPFHYQFLLPTQKKNLLLFFLQSVQHGRHPNVN